MKLQIKRIKLTVFCLISVLTLQLKSQVIEKIKDKNALIDLQGADFKKDEEFFTINESGKKVSIIKISKVKGDKAAAILLKGHFAVGEKLLAKPSSQKNQSTNAEDSEEKSANSQAFGVLLGYSIDSMTFLAYDPSNTSTSESTQLSGNTFTIKGIYDYPINNDFSIRGQAGIDGFNGSYIVKNAGINKDGSSTSKVSVSYLAFEGFGQWIFYKKKADQIWIGAGYSMLYANSFTTNLATLKVENSLSGAFLFGGGANIQIKNSQFIPIMLNFYYFTPSATLTQSIISMSGGWGMRF